MWKLSAIRSLVECQMHNPFGALIWTRNASLKNTKTKEGYFKDTSRIGVSNWWPVGRMLHAQVIPTPAPQRIKTS